MKPLLLLNVFCRLDYPNIWTYDIISYYYHKKLRGTEMRKKNNDINMYISYEKSYRKRRRGDNTLLSVIIVVILAFSIGFGTYYAVRIKAGGDSSLKKGEPYVTGNDVKSDITDVSDLTDVEPVQSDNEDYLAEAAADLDNKAKDKHEENVDANEESAKDEDKKIQEEADTRTPVRVKGMYVTSRAIMDKREELINIADTTEINAMVIDVKDDNGRITFMMEDTLAQEIGAATNTISDIEDLMKLLEEKEIYPIARIVAFKDPYLAEHRQDLAIKNKDGTLYRDNNGECWINPYEKEVWDYLVEISVKAAEAGFKEIQFDYIRFSTGKGMSEADFGPLAEEKTKEDIIIEFTKYAYEKLKPLGVFVAADVYGTIISSSIDAGLVGQNYVEMSRYLDYICPMIYPSHFAEGNYGVEYPDLEPFKIIRKVLTASRNKLEQIPEGEHRAKVRPWLQDFTASWIKHYQVYTGKQVREQIGAVYASGYSEWMLWNANCNYSVDGLDVR